MCVSFVSKRFRFCGDLDCPDWVLAEISTLAKIVSIDVGPARDFSKDELF